MKRTLLISWIISVSSFLHAQQTNQVKERIVAFQLLSSKESYRLVSQEYYVNNDSTSMENFRSMYQLKYSSDDGKTFTLCNLDSVVSKLHGVLSMPSLHMQFVNKDLGFIYGYTTVYAFYHVLFRTEDGGKTWQTIFAGMTNAPLRRNDFFMFNNQKGIIVNNWGNEPQFKYLLTKDGGKTWKTHTYTISRKDIRILNSDDLLQAFYSEDGQVTILITNPDAGYRESKKILILKSTDFGESFKELN